MADQMGIALPAGHSEAADQIEIALLAGPVDHPEVGWREYWGPGYPGGAGCPRVPFS